MSEPSASQAVAQVAAPAIIQRIDRPPTRGDAAVLFLAQGFGTGRAPVAPGTVGTLPGVLLFVLLAPLPIWGYTLLTLALALVGIALCDRAAKVLGESDPPSVVWDEIVGVAIALAASEPTWPAVLAGFLAFRLFDIWKPWPIGRIDRTVRGGLGIMLDDVVAGLMALALLALARVLGAPV